MIHRVLKIHGAHHDNLLAPLNRPAIIRSHVHRFPMLFDCLLYSDNSSQVLHKLYLRCHRSVKRDQYFLASNLSFLLKKDFLSSSDLHIHKQVWHRLTRRKGRYESLLYTFLQLFSDHLTRRLPPAG